MEICHTYRTVTLDGYIQSESLEAAINFARESFKGESQTGDEYLTHVISFVEARDTVESEVRFGGQWQCIGIPLDDIGSWKMIEENTANSPVEVAKLVDESNRQIACSLTPEEIAQFKTTLAGVKEHLVGLMEGGLGNADVSDSDDTSLAVKHMLSNDHGFTIGALDYFKEDIGEIVDDIMEVA